MLFDDWSHCNHRGSFNLEHLYYEIESELLRIKLKSTGLSARGSLYWLFESDIPVEFIIIHWASARRVNIEASLREIPRQPPQKYVEVINTLGRQSWGGVIRMMCEDTVLILYQIL